MRNFFSSDLKGGNIWWPVLLLWLMLAGDATYNIISAPARAAALPFYAMPLAWSMGGRILIEAALFVVTGIAVFALLLVLVKAFVGSITYRDRRFETEIEWRPYMNMVVKGVLLSAITLGIYSPWFLASWLRYVSSNINHGYNYLSFRGNGMTLFGIVVLSCVLPVLVLMFLASLLIGVGSTSTLFGVAPLAVTSMMPLYALLIVVALLLVIGLYYVLYYRWLIDLGYGDKSVRLDVKLFDAAMFVVGQLLLTICTLCLYAPAAVFRIYRYFVSRTVVGDSLQEARLGFVFNTWRDWGWLLLQLLLLTVTAGIYAPWFYAKVVRRFAAQTYAQIEDRPTEPMPSAN